jgi:hypothetical protein
MLGDWQDVAALALVVAAIVCLVRPFVRRTARGPAGGCALGACRGCAHSPDSRAGSACDHPIAIAPLPPPRPRLDESPASEPVGKKMGP